MACSRGRIAKFPRCISSSEENHGSRFEGIFKIEFASKHLAKAQNPANSITCARPVIQPIQWLLNTDDGEHKCLALIANTSISDIRVAHELDRLLGERGKPKSIASDI